MIKKFSVFMAGLLLCLSILTSYKVEAEAVMLPATGQAIYETFSYIFGHSMGLGTTSDGVGSDVSSDKLNSSINALKNYSNLDYSQKQFVNTGLALETYKNVLRATSQDLDAVMNAYDSVKMKELEQRAYSAYGVSYVKTSKERLDEILLDLENMSEDEFMNHLNELYSALNDDKFVGDFSDVGMTRKIFDGLNITGITYSNSYNSSLINSVSNSTYNLEDLSTTLFSYGGKNYPVYVRSVLYYINPSEFVERSQIDKNICIMPIWNTNSYSMRILYVSDKPFTLKFIENRYESDNVLGSVTSEKDDTTGLYYYEGNIGSSSYDFGFTYLSESGSKIFEVHDAYKIYLEQLLKTGKTNMLYDNVKSVSEAAPTVKEALDVMDEKANTVDDITAVADVLSNIQDEDLGDELALQQLADAISGIATTFPEAVVDGKNDVVQAVEGVGEAILTLPKAIWLEFEATLEAIGISAATATRPWEDGENKNNSLDITNIFNGVILLLLIVFVLLRIFLHCMIFIINVFRIPARPAFLPDEMVMGLEYLNTLEIPGMGLSVYAFMMGLIYILIMFYAIGVLRKSVDRIKLPKQ